MNAAVVSLVSALGHRLGTTFGFGEVKGGGEIAAVEQLLPPHLLCSPSRDYG